jgi:uncharacterized membrane protein YfcA
MIGRRILAAVLLLLALAAGYMTCLMWRAADSGKWLFGVFTLFFLVLAVVALSPKAKPQPETTATTRFVPHWFMMLAVLVIVLCILAGIISAVFRR